MKASHTVFSALSLLLAAAAGLSPLHAGLVTLSSPDNKWTLSSDEFGAHGEAAGGSFSQRDFGAGLTGYTWASGVLLSEGGTRQWLTGTNIGVSNQSLIGAGDVISDVTAGNVRTSLFNVPGFAGIQVGLTQTVSNAGISQQYVISNNRGTPVSLSVMSFRDVDLDGGTFLNNLISSTGGSLKVAENAREVYFSPSPSGYTGFLGGFVPGGGITGGLDTIGYNNFGIPGGSLNQFVDVSGAAIGASVDLNNDQISDTPGDVGYLFQHDFNIPAGGSVNVTYGQLAVPEPSSALLGLLALGFCARRRR